jgi:hypothetical protein
MRGPGYPFLIQGGTTRFAKIQLVEGLGPVAECGPTHTNTHRSVGDSRRKVQAETLADFRQIFGQIFRDWDDVVSQAALPVTRSDHLTERGVLKEGR